MSLDCLQCPFSTSSVDHFMIHNKFEHGDVFRNQCALCNFSSQYAANLEDHLGQVHEGDGAEESGIFCCEVCDFVAGAPHELRLHYEAGAHGASDKDAEDDDDFEIVREYVHKGGDKVSEKGRQSFVASSVIEIALGDSSEDEDIESSEPTEESQPSRKCDVKQEERQTKAIQISDSCTDSNKNASNEEKTVESEDGTSSKEESRRESLDQPVEKCKESGKETSFTPSNFAHDPLGGASGKKRRGRPPKILSGAAIRPDCVEPPKVKSETASPKINCAKPEAPKDNKDTGPIKKIRIWTRESIATTRCGDPIKSLPSPTQDGKSANSGKEANKLKAIPKKKRGRPGKDITKLPSATDNSKIDKPIVKDTKVNLAIKDSGVRAAKRRGRPPKSAQDANAREEVKHPYETRLRASIKVIRFAAGREQFRREADGNDAKATINGELGMKKRRGRPTRAKVNATKDANPIAEVLDLTTAAKPIANQPVEEPQRNAAENQMCADPLMVDDESAYPASNINADGDWHVREEDFMVSATSDPLAPDPPAVVGTTLNKDPLAIDSPKKSPTTEKIPADVDTLMPPIREPFPPNLVATTSPIDPPEVTKPVAVIRRPQIRKVATSDRLTPDLTAKSKDTAVGAVVRRPPPIRKTSTQDYVATPAKSTDETSAADVERRPQTHTEPNDDLFDTWSISSDDITAVKANANRKVHTCSQCPFRTSVGEWALASHVLRIHTDIDWVTCQDCGHTTKDWQRLKAHIEEVHKPRRKKQRNKATAKQDLATYFRCSLCPISFKRSDLLGRHMSGSHGNREPADGWLSAWET